MSHLTTSFAMDSIRNSVEIIAEDSGFARDVVVAKYRYSVSRYLADFVVDYLDNYRVFDPENDFLDIVTYLIDIKTEGEDFVRSLAAHALNMYIDALRHWRVDVDDAMWDDLVDAMFAVANNTTKQFDAWIESQIRLQV